MSAETHKICSAGTSRMSSANAWPRSPCKWETCFLLIESTSCSEKVPTGKARAGKEKVRLPLSTTRPGLPLGRPEVLYLIDWWLWYRPPANSMIPGVNFVKKNDNAFAAPVPAQLDHTMTSIAIPDQPNAIEIGTAPLPDATAQEAWHSQYGSQFARNVTVATITPFLPDPASASGAAVVVAPGGGFFSLSMENEGWDVARALAKHGVAAFVLKYRLNQTPADMARFQRSMTEMFSNTGRRPPRPDPEQMKVQLAPQIEDSRAAFALIRNRAAKWKIDPARIGMVGFSAGAMLT